MSVGILKHINLNDTVFVGELSLDGRVNKINGILPICLEAKRLDIKRVIIPNQNIEETYMVDGIEIIGVNSLKQLIKYINIDFKIEIPKVQKTYVKDTTFNIDFSDIKGHFFAKRALEIAVSGGHNCLLIGTPGSGKTMLAKRVQTILPDLNLKESIEVTKIHSIGGILDGNIVKKRPFRMPHYSITKNALIGGGRIPKPGEISFAHLGVLFLDELLEFKKELIEILRIPSEDKNINISRMGMNTIFPCNFMLLACCNPCPCGYYGSITKKCTCTENSIKNYTSKLSGPMLDRFDLKVYIKQVSYEDLGSKKEEKSSKIRERVCMARLIQSKRYSKETISLNSELTPGLIEKYCMLDDKSLNIINKTYESLNLSTRAYYKVLKIARTIADLDQREKINENDILEAIQYINKEKNGI